MVNEIRHVGIVSAWDLGSAGGMNSGPAKNPTRLTSTGQGNELKVDERNGTFSVRASAKDEAVQTARSVREVDSVLERADALLLAMREEVRVVKNYPPYPPGNEQRQSFISSINGLRKAMEALTVPPVEGGPEPVFYPRETGLPELDPTTTTDADVLAFGRAVDAAQSRLKDAKDALQTTLDSLWRRVASALPSPPSSEVEAIQVGRLVAEQLAATHHSVLASGVGLRQMGG